MGYDMFKISSHCFPLYSILSYHFLFMWQTQCHKRLPSGDGLYMPKSKDDFAGWFILGFTTLLSDIHSLPIYADDLFPDDHSEVLKDAFSGKQIISNYDIPLTIPIVISHWYVPIYIILCYIPIVTLDYWTGAPYWIPRAARWAKLGDTNGSR